MTTCPKCGAQFDTAMMFCTQCGTRLPKPVPETVPVQPAPETPAAPERVPAVEPVPPAPKPYYAVSEMPDAAPQSAQPQGRSAQGYSQSYPQSAQGYAQGQPQTPQTYPQSQPQSQPQPRQTYQPSPASPAAPAKPAPAPAKDTAAKKDGSVTMWGFLGAKLLLGIPVVGLIAAIVWACGGTKKRELRRYAQASLLLGLITVLLMAAAWFAVATLARDTINKLLAPYGYELRMPGDTTVLGGEQPVSGSADPIARLNALLSGDSYRVEYRMLLLGQDFGSGTMLRKDGNEYSSTTAFGQEDCLLRLDGVTYRLDGSSKSYYVTNEEIASPDFNGTLNGQMTENGSGSGTFDGQSLPYVQYTGSNVEELRVYQRNGEVYGIQAKVSGMEMSVIFDVISSEVTDTGLLAIPAGYQEGTAAG